MEQQVEAVHSTVNGVEKQAPVDTLEATPSRPVSLELRGLMEKREKMMQGLNGIKADRDTISQQLQDYETRIKRTEGAVILLDQLITELDPTALQQGR